MAKEQGWRARSAFKLMQVDEEFNLLEGNISRRHAYFMASKTDQLTRSDVVDRRRYQGC